jgi:hypothetical protein
MNFLVCFISRREENLNLLVKIGSELIERTTCRFVAPVRNPRPSFNNSPSLHIQRHLFDPQTGKIVQSIHWDSHVPKRFINGEPTASEKLGGPPSGLLLIFRRNSQKNAGGIRCSSESRQNSKQKKRTNHACRQ